MIPKIFVFLLIVYQSSSSVVVPDSSFQWMVESLFERIFNLQRAGDTGSGGIPCAGCTMALGLVEQLAQIHSTSVDKILSEICSYFPNEIQTECVFLVDLFGPSIISGFSNYETPDMICQDIRVCTNDTCRLFPPPIKSINYDGRNKVNQLGGKLYENLQRPLVLPKWIWPWERVAKHLPLFDADGDNFSDYPALRGYHWRGGDCNDAVENIYPGRKTSNYPDSVDHNCNGIHGHNNKGTSYEDLFCKETPPFGTIILGDSAGAHFHIPSSWITASQMNESVYADLMLIAENELDWPFMSSATGFMNISWAGVPVGPIDSGYLRNWNRNHCAFRDYQNIAVDGARSSSMLHSIIQSMSRNPTLDYPVSLSYALIGNDVCNGHYGSGSMTTPQEFYSNVAGALQYLDQVLPSGSHVSFIGLVDGRILYDSMGDRIHPIGSTNKNVKYSDFYDFLNCLGISPCFGWMNSDPYWRNVTTERAMELNQVYRDLVTNTSYKNFDIHYFDCPLEQVVKIWKKQGGEAWELIEPVDGFHPNQISDALTTEVLWGLMDKIGILPPINPHNAEIEEIFGDQGGYIPSE